MKTLLTITNKMLTIVVFILLVSCSDEEDYKDLYAYYFNVVEVYNENPDSTYLYTYNRNVLRLSRFSIDGGVPIAIAKSFTPEKNPEGILQIYGNDSITPLLEETICPKENDTIKIIIQDGVHLYSPETYLKCTLNLIYQTGQSELYNAIYTDDDFQANINGSIYIPVKNTEGTIQIVRTDRDTIVFSKTVEVVEGSRFDILQIDDNAFLDVTISNDEVAPVDIHHTKVRFFLDAAINTGGEDVRMLIYNAEGVVCDTLDFNPGTSASPFSEMDLSQSYKSEVYKLSDMSKLVSKRSVSFDSNGNWKFQTLKVSKYYSTFMEDLSVEW